MLEVTLWHQHTQPARAAWYWAWAVAMARTGAAEPAEVVIDSLDLGAGLALAHPQDSPVSQLLAHFDIAPGAVLGAGGTRRYDAEALLAAARRVPAEELPHGDREVTDVAGAALDLAQRRERRSGGADGLVSLPMLLAALLERDNQFSAGLRVELTSRGVQPQPVLQSCRQHLASRLPYQDYLRQHHPYQRREIQVPGLHPDQPCARQSSGRPGDLVGIDAEVDAFAYLIASRSLTPPLAIGLFGDWGSGKSFFLRSLQRRIDQLVSTDVQDPPFHRAVAQVEFNAWQYVEGNLWASLLEHLFRNLRRAGDSTDGEDTDDLLASRRREYLTRITERTAEHRAATQRRDELAEQRQNAQEQVQAKADERDRSLAQLHSARRRNPFTGWTPSAALDTALTEVRQRTGLGELATQAGELRETLASTAESLRRAGPLAAALRAGGWRYTAAVIVVIALGPLTSLALSQLDVSAVSNAVGSASALLAGLVAAATMGGRLVTGALDAISTAQARLDAELEARRQEFDEQLQQAEVALAGTERELESAVAQENQLATAVTDLEAELARVTPSSVLAEFLGHRIGSDDYRRHLGMPALVRQDLERLSRLIQQRHQSGAVPDEHAIDRVVLYIDDLDRCPTDVVVKVLEAVHLLLAFPLFVVVVAVDARWLESSLREHYSQLRAEAAVPADYLEKIFQVPFWVRPLGPQIRRQLVRGLASPDQGATTADAGLVAEPHSGAGVDLSEVDLPEFARLVATLGDTTRIEPAWLQAARLTVDGPELDRLEEVSPLVGQTPRAIKRFVNVYLLLKSAGRGRGWTIPEQGQVALLLAIATGLPDVADRAFAQLSRPDQRHTLRTALPGKIDHRLTDWLEQHPWYQDLPLSGLQHWIELIARFRFQPATTLTSARPFAVVANVPGRVPPAMPQSASPNPS